MLYLSRGRSQKLMSRKAREKPALENVCEIYVFTLVDNVSFVALLVWHPVLMYTKIISRTFQNKKYRIVVSSSCSSKKGTESKVCPTYYRHLKLDEGIKRDR